MAKFLAKDKPNKLEEGEVSETIKPSGKSSYKVVVRHREKFPPVQQGLGID